MDLMYNGIAIIEMGVSILYFSSSLRVNII